MSNLRSGSALILAAMAIVLFALISCGEPTTPKADEPRKMPPRATTATDSSPATAVAGVRGASPASLDEYLEVCGIGDTETVETEEVPMEELAESFRDHFERLESVEPPPEVAEWHDAVLVYQKDVVKTFEDYVRDPQGQSEDEFLLTTVFSLALEYQPTIDQAVADMDPEVRSLMVAAGCIEEETAGSVPSAVEGEEIAVGGSVKGTLDEPNEIDLYQFEAESGTEYLIKITWEDVPEIVVIVKDIPNPYATKVGRMDSESSPLVMEWTAEESETHTIEIFSGDATGSYTVSVLLDTSPDAPLNVRYAWEGPAIRVSWDSVEGAEYYNVYHDDFAPGCSVDIDGNPKWCDRLATDVVGASYLHSSPDADKNLYWVVACNSGGCSAADSENPAILVGEEPGSRTPALVATPIALPTPRSASVATPTALPTPTPASVATPTAPPTPTPASVATPTASPTRTPVSAAAPASDESLCQAINYQDTSTIEELVDSGADVNARCESLGTVWYDGVVPLHIAVNREADDIVQLLLDAGADTSARGDSPLCTAVNYEATETVRLLVDAGADKDERCQTGRGWYHGTTPAAIADKHAYAEVQQILQDPPAGIAGATASEASERDRDALTALYDSTDGQAWTYSDNWLTDQPLAKWYGVTTDEDGRVTELALFDNQLSGPIPESLTELSELRWIDLSDNGLTGILPDGLHRLSQLRWLYAANNDLTGSISPRVGELSLLRQLELENNRLSGTIPPELGDLSNLKSLYLGSNELTGPVPSELGNLKNLVGLYLFDNQLDGPIPSELGNLSELRRLQLHSNRLSGPIPVALDDLDKLVLLSLHENDLSGELPMELGGLSSLRVLLLHGNQFSGQIPDSFGELTELVLLSLHDNLLEGEIPKALGKLTNLAAVSLFEGTELIGAIPDGIDATIEGVESVMEHLGGPAGAAGDMASAVGSLISRAFFGFFGLW